MRILAFLVLAAWGLPAHAQLMKCIDERGRVHYTDKPIPGCKPTAQQPAPVRQPSPAPAAKKQAPKALAKAAPRAKEPPPSVSECKAAQEQKDWLLGDRGRQVDMREARLGQLEQVLRKCR